MFNKTKKLIALFLSLSMLGISNIGLTAFANEDESTENSTIIAEESIEVEDSEDITLKTLTSEEYMEEHPIDKTGDEDAVELFGATSNRIYNEYIEASVNYEGRFSIGTVAGNPDNTKDDNKKMLYGHPSPGTSHTTIRLDGTNYTYYITDTSETQIDDANSKHTSFMNIDSKIKVTQELSIVKNLTTGLFDTIQIKYVAKNTDTRSHNLGLRIMMDTMLWNNDHAPFKIPGYGELTTQKEFAGNDIPQYWQVFDSLTDPSVIAAGTLIKSSANKPDRVQFTNWGTVTDTLWGHVPTEGYSNGDSAVCVIWDEEPLAAGQVKTCITYYGLSAFESSQLTNYLVNVSAPKSLELDATETNYEPNPFTVTAYIQNVTSETKTNVKAKINLPPELTLFDTSVQEVDLGTLGAGENKLASWIIFAAGQTQEKEVTYTIDVTDGEGTENVPSTITLPQVFESDKTIADLGFSRTMGHLYEQRVDVAVNTIKPKVKKVNVTTLDAEKGKYKFEIKSGNFVCDSSGRPFFYWEAENGVFLSAEDDYRTVEFMVDAGTGGEKVEATVYIGDGLGYIGQYTVRVDGKNYSSGDGELTCEFVDEIQDANGWSTVNIKFNAYLLEEMTRVPGTIVSIFYNNNGEWTPIVRDIVDRQSYQWIVPNKKLNNTKLKITAVNGTESKTVTSNTFDITPTCYVQGKVLTMDDAPIVGATVTVNGQSAVTDYAGYYIIKNLTPGTYTATVEGSGYVQSTQRFTVSHTIPQANKIFRKR